MKISTRTRRLAAGLLGVALVGGLSACGAQARASNVIEFWTVLTGDVDIKAQEAVIAAFEEEYPQYDVRLVRKPNPGGAPNGDLTVSVAAVRGGQPADVYLTDRFAIAQQASVGLLENLQPRVDAEGGTLPDQYLPFAIAEATFEDDLYGLPIYTDTRALFYNNDVLRDAGIDPDVMHPRHGPLTIDEAYEIGKQINETDDNGNYTRMGWIPWDDQAFNATYALQRGARYFDNETCQFTPTEPAFMQTYEQFGEWAEDLNFDRVQAFLATYRPPNAPPEQGLLYTGRVGMTLSGNWLLANIRDYAPDLDFGMTYVPVAEEGDKPFNWSGGFGLVMPTGAQNRDAGWEFMKFFTGEQGQAIYTESASQLPTWKSLADDPELLDRYGVMAEGLQYTVSRPPLPVAAAIDGALGTAQQAVLAGEETPEEALQKAADRVNPQLETFCPFKLTTWKPAER